MQCDLYVSNISRGGKKTHITGVTNVVLGTGRKSSMHTFGKHFRLAFCPKWEEEDSIQLLENPENHKKLRCPLQWDLSAK